MQKPSKFLPALTSLSSSIPNTAARVSLLQHVRPFIPLLRTLQWPHLSQNKSQFHLDIPTCPIWLLALSLISYLTLCPLILSAIPFLPLFFLKKIWTHSYLKAFVCSPKIGRVFLPWYLFHLFLHFDIYSNVTFSKRPDVATLSKIIAISNTPCSFSLLHAFPQHLPPSNILCIFLVYLMYYLSFPKM